MIKWKKYRICEIGTVVGGQHLQLEILKIILMEILLGSHQKIYRRLIIDILSMGREI